jgi:hypothetical protein
MISEKTVELNLTTEFMNWMWKVHHSTFTAIAPSQRQEALLGYDVSIRASGFGFFIQYKRAHLKGREYIYELNRTKARDQHKKLCDLEARGFPVFYALPVFTTVREVIGYRRQLLLHTLWLPPSSIPVPGGGVGHHEVHYDASTCRHWVTSEDEIPFIPEFTGVDAITNILDQRKNENNLIKAMYAFNEIFIKGEKEQGFEVDFDDSSIAGISLMSTLHEQI